MNFKALAITALILTPGPVLAEGPTPEARALIDAALRTAAKVTPAELKRLLEGDRPVLLDVRQESEIPIQGRILPQGQQIEIPRGYIEIRAYGLLPDRNTRIIVYCGTGIRSAFVFNTLKAMGYTDVAHLEGGATAWRDAGYPLHLPAGSEP